MITIAIDGPSGSGKSTIAKMLSKELNILYLDTGAMYRACGLKAKMLGVDTKNEEQVNAIIDKLDISVKYENGAQVTMLDGIDVSLDIRKNDISMRASEISAHQNIRKKLVDLQREIASKQSCVLDGRDIGTVVLPNAKYKFFVTASPKARADRRYKELVERGETVDYNVLLKEIIKRDENDSTRANSPLKQAEDAIYIDTSSMTISEVIKTVLSYINK